MIAPGKTAPITVPSLGATLEEERGCAAAAGAWLVLGDDGRIAGDEAIEMPRDHAGIDVVAAADVAP